MSCSAYCNASFKFPMSNGCFVVIPLGDITSRWKNPCAQSYLTILCHVPPIFASYWIIRSTTCPFSMVMQIRKRSSLSGLIIFVNSLIGIIQSIFKRGVLSSFQQEIFGEDRSGDWLFTPTQQKFQSLPGIPSDFYIERDWGDLNLPICLHPFQGFLLISTITPAGGFEEKVNRLHPFQGFLFILTKKLEEAGAGVEIVSIPSRDSFSFWPCYILLPADSIVVSIPSRDSFSFWRYTCTPFKINTLQVISPGSPFFRLIFLHIAFCPIIHNRVTYHKHTTYKFPRIDFSMISANFL